MPFTRNTTTRHDDAMLIRQAPRISNADDIISESQFLGRAWSSARFISLPYAESIRRDEVMRPYTPPAATPLSCYFASTRHILMPNF